MDNNSNTNLSEFRRHYNGLLPEPSTPEVSNRTFHSFPLLPKELRLQIWELSKPAPRIVYVQRQLHQQRKDGASDTTSALTPPCPTPALLLVNQETHDLCLSWGYVFAFGEADSQPSIWFNFSIDTLYLDWGYGCSNTGGDNRTFYLPSDFGADAKKVRRLTLYQSIGSHWYHGRPHEEGWVCDILDVFDDLDGLYFVDQFHTLEESLDLCSIEQSDRDLWSDKVKYGHCPRIDALTLEEYCEKWFVDDDGPSPWRLNDDAVKAKSRRWEDEGILPWRVGEVRFMSAVSTVLEDKLERICASEEFDELICY